MFGFGFSLMLISFAIALVTGARAPGFAAGFAAFGLATGLVLAVAYGLRR